MVILLNVFSALFSLIPYAFNLWIAISIIYAFQTRIRDYVDSDYIVSLGMTVDMFIFFAVLPLFQGGIIFFPIINNSIILFTISAIGTVILLYGLGIYLMKMTYKKHRKDHPIQVDDIEKIFND